MDHRVSPGAMVTVVVGPGRATAGWGLGAGAAAAPGSTSFWPAWMLPSASRWLALSRSATETPVRDERADSVSPGATTSVPAAVAGFSAALAAGAGAGLAAGAGAGEGAAGAEGVAAAGAGAGLAGGGPDGPTSAR